MTESQRDQLIVDHLPLVKAIAARIKETLPVHVDMDDLIHNGILGLFDAAKKFDPKNNVKFASYAKYRVKGAILDSLRGLDWASRDMRKRHKQVEAARRELTALLQRHPTESEVAEKLGLSEERWRRLSMDLRIVGEVSCSSRNDPDSDLPAPDSAASPKTHPDAICINDQLASVLKEALKILPPRDRQVITLYYNAEMTMKEVGDIMGINESRVSQIHGRAVRRLYEYFAEHKLTLAALA